jgi:hypothetical protein
MAKRVLGRGGLGEEAGTVGGGGAAKSPRTGEMAKRKKRKVYVHVV